MGGLSTGAAALLMAVILLLLYPLLAEGNRSGTIGGMQGTLMIALWILLLLVLGYVMVRYILSISRQMRELRERQVEELLQYSRHIELLHDELRGFRHDYANLLVTLEQGIYSDDMEMVKAAYERVLKPAGDYMKAERFSFARLADIRTPELKSLLSAKLIMAEQRQIKVHLEVAGSFEKLYLNRISLLRILAVLLDNAMEAAEVSDQKELSAALIEDEEQQIFDIRNSISGEADLDQMFQKGYSTKGKDRGIGLFNVRELLKEERHVIFTTEADHGMVMQKLIIQKTGASGGHSHADTYSGR